jgi:hypothetical protein
MLAKHYHLRKHFGSASGIFAPVARSYTARMTVKDIRRRNLLALVQSEADGKIAAFGRRFGLSEKYIRLIKGRHSDCGHQFARDVEAALGRVKGGTWDGWMDRDHTHDAKEPAPPAIEPGVQSKIVELMPLLAPHQLEQIADQMARLRDENAQVVRALGPKFRVVEQPLEQSHRGIPHVIQPPTSSKKARKKRN